MTVTQLVLIVYVIVATLAAFWLTGRDIARGG